MKIPYDQIIIGLDKLIFSKIASQVEAEDRLDVIEAYLEATGWTWDLIIGQLIAEEIDNFPTKIIN